MGSWIQWIVTFLVLTTYLALVMWVLYRSESQRNQVFSASHKELTELLRHMTDLLSAKDPMTYQVLAANDTQVVVSDYDPSDQAEIARLRERGTSDSALYDDISAGSDDLASWERDAIIDEITGRESR